MSTTADIVRPPSSQGASVPRTMAAVRAQLVAPVPTFGWPWGVLAAAFLINVLLLALISAEDRANANTGALVSIYIVVFTGAIQAVTQFYPFCAGLSFTRRTFFAAACLIQAAHAVLFGLALWLGLLVERATNDWGLSMQFFGPKFVLAESAVGQVAVYGGPFLLMSALGMLWGAIRLRWGTTGLYLAGIIVVAGVGGVITLLTATESWPAVGDWLAGSSTVVLLAGWPTLAAVALAAVAYAVLRRATPTPR